MERLDTISVRNFKSIRELDLPLRPLNVLIGANGVGKSNFIEIFEFLNQIIESRLQNYTASKGGADNILYFGRKNSDDLTFTLSFNEGTNGYSCRLLPTVEDSFYFESEEVWFHARQYSKPYYETIGTGHHESKLPELTKHNPETIKGYVYHFLKSWKLYHFHDTSDNAPVKRLCDLEDNRMLHPDARNLAAFLYYLENKRPDYFQNIQDTVKMVAPFFECFNLHPSRLNEEKIRLEWKEIGSDDYFNASSLSDGTLRFICLATLLLQPNIPSIVLLDEPELGLHPYAISVLADLLESAAQRSQVIVATQSVTLVNQFNPDHIIAMDREDSQSVFRRLDQEDMSDWLDDYGLGDLWEKNVFGGRP